MTDPAPIDRPAVEAMIAHFNSNEARFDNQYFSWEIADTLTHLFTAYEAEKARADNYCGALEAAARHYAAMVDSRNEARVTLAKCEALAEMVDNCTFYDPKDDWRTHGRDPDFADRVERMKHEVYMKGDMLTLYINEGDWSLIRAQAFAVRNRSAT